MDKANLLTPEQEAHIAADSAELEARTGHQLAVVTVGSLAGAKIEVFADVLWRRWGIGRKGYDDGVLLLVAPNERKVRIGVGRGLESVLSDAVCQRIIDEDILPSFRRGEYASGIEAGANAIVADLRS